MEFVNEYIVGCSVLVAPLVEVIVKPFITDTRFYPLFSILLGELCGLAFFLNGEADITTMIVSGLVCGLTASGIYSGVNALKK